MLLCFIYLQLTNLSPLYDDQIIQSHDGRHSYKLALMRVALDRALDLIRSFFHTFSAVWGFEAPSISGSFCM